MLKRKIGQSGIEASVVGLGTWGMGGWMWGGTDENAAIEAIHASLDVGVTLIDTAPAYGLGLSEELVGRAIKDRRDQVILATKCGLTWHTRQGQYFFEENGQSVHRYLGAASIRYELEQSLHRLKTDYIDLYQTHWQDPTTPIAETMQTLLDLKKEGKIRAIGGSNISPDELQSYTQVGLLDSIQEKYSMLDREIEATLLPYCREHDIAILTYSTLAMGLLTGKIGPDRVFTGDDQRVTDPRFSMENRLKVTEMLSQLTPIAERYNLTLPQLVIAWTIHQPGITFALCGARNRAQALENAQAGQIKLDEDDLQTINTLLQTHAAQIV
jgi:methylglyoxal reductase